METLVIQDFLKEARIEAQVRVSSLESQVCL